MKCKDINRVKTKKMESDNDNVNEMKIVALDFQIILELCGMITTTTKKEPVDISLAYFGPLLPMRRCLEVVESIYRHHLSSKGRHSKG